MAAILLDPYELTDDVLPLNQGGLRVCINQACAQMRNLSSQNTRYTGS